MSKELNKGEWKKIMKKFKEDPYKYGLPRRVYGSVVLGSFNIRKLGKKTSRSESTWEFLARVCSHFDLISVQEILDDMSGLNKLMELLGPDYGLIVSDITGAIPGGQGMTERLGYIFKWSVVKRTQIASDISYDRTEVNNTLVENKDKLFPIYEEHAIKLKKHQDWIDAGRPGKDRDKPVLRLPVFVSFIRQPYCVSFEVHGHGDKLPYKFMVVNAHLYFGEVLADRRQEFDALMCWILNRVKMDNRTYYDNFLLMGDLNLIFKRPVKHRKEIEGHLKTFNSSTGKEINVYFPFLDKHPVHKKYLRTNARLDETFDQIGMFSIDKRLPTFEDTPAMGKVDVGPDYGVFNFVQLFADVLKVKNIKDKKDKKVKVFFKKFEHEVSDHMPLWIRLPLP